MSCRVWGGPCPLPDVYDRLAERLIPTSGTGFQYLGAQVEDFFGMSGPRSKRTRISLFLHWGSLAWDWPAYYCSMNLSWSSYAVPDGVRPWFIPHHSRFRTRAEAVAALASSLRQLGLELAEVDPAYQAIVHRRSELGLDADLAR